MTEERTDYQGWECLSDPKCLYAILDGYDKLIGRCIDNIQNIQEILDRYYSMFRDLNCQMELIKQRIDNIERSIRR